jgi:Domain of unknown function (DUF4573)
MVKDKLTKLIGRPFARLGDVGRKVKDYVTLDAVSQYWDSTKKFANANKQAVVMGGIVSLALYGFVGDKKDLEEKIVQVPNPIALSVPEKVSYTEPLADPVTSPVNVFSGNATDSVQVTETIYPTAITEAVYPTAITEAVYPTAITETIYPTANTDSVYVFLENATAPVEVTSPIEEVFNKEFMFPAGDVKEIVESFTRSITSPVDEILYTESVTIPVCEDGYLSKTRTEDWEVIEGYVHTQGYHDKRVLSADMCDAQATITYIDANGDRLVNLGETMIGVSGFYPKVGETNFVVDKESMFPAGEGKEIVEAVYPTSNTETIYPTSNTETIYPTSNTETIYPTSNTETIYPTSNTETIYPTANTDSVYPTANTDSVYPTANTDSVYPTSNSETIYPTSNTETIYPTSMTSTIEEILYTESVTIPVCEGGYLSMTRTDDWEVIAEYVNAQSYHDGRDLSADMCAAEATITYIDANGDRLVNLGEEIIGVSDFYPAINLRESTVGEVAESGEPIEPRAPCEDYWLGCRSGGLPETHSLNFPY